MANADHLAMLQQGVEAWNAWRAEEPSVNPELTSTDLRGADLSEANLHGANLSSTNLGGAKLHRVNLRRANLGGTNLNRADLLGAHLGQANLCEADLRRASLVGVNLVNANLWGADLRGADLWGVELQGADLRDLVRPQLHGADLRKANFREADLRGVDLGRADLREADLMDANLGMADLGRADLRKANLMFTNLVEANFRDADLTGCRIYGVSAWKLTLEGAKQQDLIITDMGEPDITVDNIEVAQFVYLLLHNEKIRDVIDTIGKKAVLILGRFTLERKAVLDALRDELRKHDYLPILFDFDKPTSKDLTGTVLTLAHMARFIIADLTDPSCIPYEVSKVADAFVPVQPILLSGKSEFAMFADMQRRHHWVLATHRYDTPEQLIANLGEGVIRPAEAKVLELRGPPPE